MKKRRAARSKASKRRTANWSKSIARSIKGHRKYRDAKIAEAKAASKRVSRHNRMLEDFRSRSVRECIKRTARYFQKMVRLEAADENGNCTCVTCGRVMRWNHRGCHAGHYYSRTNVSIVFHPINCHVQCAHCNNWLNGNIGKYREFMEATYSEDELANLAFLKNVVKKWSKEELVDLRIEYMDRCKYLESKLPETNV